MSDKLDDLLVQLIESHADRVRVLKLIAEQRDAEVERLRAALDEIREAYRKLGEAPNSDIRALARAHLFSVLLQTVGNAKE